MLDTELAETRREDQIEADLGRAEQAADQRAADEIAAADSERRRQETVAERTDKLAEAERREPPRAGAGGRSAPGRAQGRGAGPEGELMTIQTLPRTLVAGAIKVVRLPADLALA